MTQRIFDVENEKDMQNLWDTLQDHIIKLVKPFMSGYLYPKYVLARSEDGEYELPIAINWHDKTEITRPIQECTEQDIGKLCAFYDEPDETDDKPYIYYAVLHKIENQSRNTWFYTDRCDYFTHCRRLTKQEIKELC